MTRKHKLIEKAQRNPGGLRFPEAIQLARLLGFNLDRVSGSHHIFVHPTIAAIVNLQSVNGKAKAYQVKQLLKQCEHNKLIGEK